MPLSEREQQILQQIEQSLYKEDPNFARGVARRFRRFSEARMAKLGGLCLVGGLAALIAFFVTRIVPVGLVAFGAMVGGIFLLATSIHAVLTRPKDEKPARKERFESFLRSLEERMRDRYRRR